MSDVVIQAQNLGKKYVIGHQTAKGQYMTFRDVLVQNARSYWHKVKDLAQGKPVLQGDTQEEVWALKDVSFEIKRGEAVGIIGRNGAGKSTLLKILSRITEPSAGRVTIRGRVASLLEVGTGFHPELTGRENIYLNGAILGMTRAEIKRKFDEIVAFAEVEKFLDTPVKRYSSGMYVRLAFAVAAHLEPEILIVDEVLAVGDAAFQRKCLGKMGEVSRDGRTVLFVSHNMPAVTRLCQRGVLLDKGEIEMDGDVQSVAMRYLNSGLGTSAEKTWQTPDSAPGDGVARLKAVRIVQGGKTVDTVDIRYPLIFEVEYWNLKNDARLLVAVNLFNDEGVLLFLSADFQENEWCGPRPPGIYMSRCTVPGNFFSEGIVRVLAEVCTREPVWQSHVREMNVVSVNVVDRGEPGSVRADWGRPIAGVVRPMLGWKTVRLDAIGEREARNTTFL